MTCSNYSKKLSKFLPTSLMKNDTSVIYRLFLSWCKNHIPPPEVGEQGGGIETELFIIIILKKIPVGLKFGENFLYK